MLIFSSPYAFRRYHSVIYCILALSMAAYGIILIRASAHPAGVFCIIGNVSSYCIIRRQPSCTSAQNDCLLNLYPFLL